MKYFRTGLGLFFLLFTGHSFAQAPTSAPSVQLSPAFPEPGEGFDKLILLPDGNTCYLHFDKKQGIIANIYNEQRAATATEVIKGKLWDASNLNDTEIDGIFAINNQVVIFLQQLVKYKPNLYRLVLDGNTGKLLQEDKLGELPTVLHRDVMVQDNFASHDFHVSKDPNSGYYAIASFAGGELQRKESPAERVQILHFSPDHQLIRRSYYTVSDNYPYLAYMDMTVQGGERIYLATVAMNNRRSLKDTSAIVVISAISKSDSSFTHTILPYAANFTDVHASIQYASAVSGLQVLLTTTNNQSAKAAVPASYLNYFDAGTLAFKNNQQLGNEKVAAFAQQKMKYTGAYTGQPQAFITKADGSSTVLLENMSQFATSGSSNSWNKMHTNMNDIGVSEIDASGHEQSGYALVKLQIANGTYEPLYFHRKKKGQWIFRNRIQALNTTPYLSYEYLPTPKATYIIFNDYLAYLDAGGTFQDKKPLRYLTEANTVCYRCTDTNQERLFLFGTPETFKGYYCMLGASDYDEKKYTYATIMITRKGEDKKACIAWVKF